MNNWIACPHNQGVAQPLRGSTGVELDTEGRAVLLLCPICTSRVRDVLISDLLNEAVKGLAKQVERDLAKAMRSGT